MIKTIAIVGRPNVGKSALFNAMVSKRKALTSPNPGLTRDRTYSYFSTAIGNEYMLIDTGGLILNEKHSVIEEVNMQVDVAIDQADLLLFVVDILDGQLPLDEQIADKLRRSAKKTIIIANKADIPEKDMLSNEFYNLGFETVVPVSAIHKRNMSGLIDEITAILPESSKEEKRGDSLTICIAGKPNVGKSTLVNRLAGEKRVIVDDKPGTTRNPARCYVRINDKDWELVDLAGLWRKKKGKEVEEIISMMAARKEIEKADICIFMLDLTKPLVMQDSRIAGWIVEFGTSVIIAGNKSDLVKKKKDLQESYRTTLINGMPFMDFAPFVMISAKTGKGIDKIHEELDRVAEKAFVIIPQPELDMLLPKLLAKRPPPQAANERPKVLRLYQKGTNPPVFHVVVSHYRIDKIPLHWKNYIRNSIYKEYDFSGVPVIVDVIGKKTTSKKK